MRKFILKKVKQRRETSDNSTSARGSLTAGSGSEAWQSASRNPAPLLLDDSPDAYLASYQEVPMILDWQTPSYVPGSTVGATPLSQFPKPTRQVQTYPRTHNPPTAPPFPLPLELMYLVIDNDLSHDLKAMLNLASAVPDLRHHCWTHAFHSAKIIIRQRETERKKETSNVDLFLQLLDRIPAIYDYVQELDIQDRGRLVWAQQGLASSSQEDMMTLSLLLVQTKRMPRLKSFRITTTLTWSILPIHVKEAFFAMFASSTLSEIALSGILLPVNFLTLVKGLRTVEFQTGGVGPSVFHPSLIDQRPKQVDTLKIRDRNPFSNPMSVLGFSGHSHKPFSLPHIKQLEICLPGKQLSSVQEGLQVCQKLELFKVFVGTAGGLPDPLKLDCLPSLQRLTLAADITNILDASCRFYWAIELLASIPTTSLLQDVTLLIRTPSLEQGKQCEWGLLDALFHLPDIAPALVDARAPGVSLRWPSLCSFNIIWCTARSQDIQEDANADLMEYLPIFIPHLHVRGVVRMRTTYSDTHYNFWTYT